MDQHAVREQRSKREQIGHHPERERRPETSPAAAADRDAAPEAVGEDVHQITWNEVNGGWRPACLR